MQNPHFVLPKVIGDPIHGQIPLSNLEFCLLQLPTVNRLHYVKQTATAYMTFPSSVTTRFAHAVGTVHVGHKIIRQLFDTLDGSYCNDLFDGLSEEFVTKTVRLACLFHDVGHGPFSHSAEEMMYNITKTKKEEIQEAKDLFVWGDQPQKKLPIHEYFSYKLITNGEIHDTIVNHREGSQELVNSAAALIVKSDKIKFAKKHPKECFILRKIISSQLDADRMDYLLRDSWMSGVKFGHTDVNRIISNMVIKKTKLKNYDIAINSRALGSVEDMLDARLKMYKWFYQHHTVTATNTLMENAIKLLISKDHNSARLFHWSSYYNGESTDEVILSKLRHFIKTDEDFREFKGLIDRRYLPVSILKHPHDYKLLVDKIKGASSDKIHDNILKQKLNTFCNISHSSELENIISKKLDIQKKLVLMLKNFPRSSPYTPLSKSETILFFTERDQNLKELTLLSTYAVKINEEWTQFPSLFVFYVILKKSKHDAEPYKEKIMDLIAEAIANIK